MGTRMYHTAYCTIHLSSIFFRFVFPMFSSVPQIRRDKRAAPSQIRVTPESQRLGVGRYATGRHVNA